MVNTIQLNRTDPVREAAQNDKALVVLRLGIERLTEYLYQPLGDDVLTALSEGEHADGEAVLFL